MRHRKSMRYRTKKILFVSLFIFIFSFQFYIMLHTPPLISIPPSTSKNAPARLAYYISGSAGDSERLKRLLQAIYHPHNVYIVVLDLAVSRNEHQDLSDYVDTHVVFSYIGNVKIASEHEFFEEDSVIKIESMLGAAAIMMRDYGKWDWFVKLDASDYPLVTQDDLLYVLSHMPRHLNFINHGIDVSGKLDDEREAVLETLKADRADDFDLFAGSPWMTLTYSFMDYCIRRGGRFHYGVILMYEDYSIYSEKSYFQTVICNSREFFNTTVNTDLRFAARNDSYVTTHDYLSMLRSSAPFARKFDEEHSYHMYEVIDRKILSRGPNMLVPGGWCAGLHLARENIRVGEIDPCLMVADVTNIQPGPGILRLQKFFGRHVNNVGTVSSPRCRRFDGF